MGGLTGKTFIKTFGVASVATVFSLLSIGDIQAGTTKRELMRWMDAHNAKRIVGVCHKRLGGYEKDLARFTKAEAEASRAFTGNKDKDLARIFGGGWYPIEKGLERARWKSFCRAYISKMRWKVR
ncbi:hypothetical protein [uncultured Hoeflea sp.]|uniref:hypothetical protein n=1 Tax=uncultured Hoeflea sp. TaxID=538666 RepID=UPI0030EEBE10